MAWERASSWSEVPPGALVGVRVGRRRVVLVRLGDDLRAFEDACTHAGCPLSQGVLRDGAITCLCHGARFDARTGVVVRRPATQPLSRLEAERRGDDVWIDV